MNNKQGFFNNDVEVNVSEEEIILAPPTELYDEAKEIAQKTAADEKYPFTLQYDANQKDHLQSMLQMVGAVVEDGDEEGHKFSTRMNMTQLAFIKRLDCVERVRTDEGHNPFPMEETVKPETVETQPAQIMTLAADEAVAVTAEEPAMTNANDGIATACESGGTTGSSCCTTNNTMANATAIPVNVTAKGNFCCPGVAQWFKFTPSSSGEYSIYTMGSLDTMGELYDENGTWLNFNDDIYGKLNFRIDAVLAANTTYYIRVAEANSNTGSYHLRVTDEILVDNVTILPSAISLKKGVLYELPLSPDYTYKGYNGAQRIPGLSVSISPSNASEQMISWYTLGDNLNCSYGWDDDGDRYIHITATGYETTKLYANDWNENGMRGECVVTVVTPYCGGDNYRDVTQHTMVLQSDGYYVCSKCGYRIKSPAVQDKDILSQDDYLKMIAVMHYYAHNLLLAREYPISAYFYNAEAEKCKIVMDTIRSQKQYASAYEYQSSNNKYLAGETNDAMVTLVSKSAINAWTIGSYNGFYETLSTLVIGYYCPPMGALIDIISLAKDITTGEMDAISFGSFIAGLMDLDDIATALSLFSSASDVIDCDVVIGDPVVRISFSAYAQVEYVFDTNYNIKKVSINYTV